LKDLEGRYLESRKKIPVRQDRAVIGTKHTLQASYTPLLNIKKNPQK
jgi:hypothetical protein